MRYIKTRDGIYEFRELVGFETYLVAKSNEDSASLYQIEQKDIINKSDIIEELCDEWVVVHKDFHDLHNANTHCLQSLRKYYEINKIEVSIFGAIWVEIKLPDGRSVFELKPVTKPLNDKGELELL